MGLINLPEAPPGVSPHDFYLAYVAAIFDQTPTRGFVARLNVLYALAAYGIVASSVFFVVLLVEYRRRKKAVWLWRLVRRSNGRYIVGNQHFLFAIFSFISCAVLIGYFVNFHHVFIKKTHQHGAFYWRTLIWIVYGVHLWITSFSNLQAGILSSQSAAKTNILSPIFMNTLYIGAFVAMFVSCLSLDVACGWAWAQTWDANLNVIAQLKVLAATRPNDTPEEALASVDGLLDRVNSRLGLVIATLRASNALYAFGFSLIIAANLGGLGLLFTLQKQIKFNMRRLSDEQAFSTPAVSPGVPLAPTEEAGDPLDATPRPFSFSARRGEKTPSNTPARQVMFVRSVEQKLEGPDTAPEAPAPTSKGLSVGELKHVAADGAPASAAHRQQAKQLLALKKVQWDVLVLLGAIVLIATFCVAIGLWLAIAPLSVYARWPTTETAYFLVPWMYLVGVDVALTLLLLNTVRHVVPNDTFLAKLLGQSSGRRRRTSATGLLSSDDLDSTTVASSMAEAPDPFALENRRISIPDAPLRR
ncbi:hypothetical protein JCM10908_007331 [Rhodotorula pacifica]|uniref:uncharacterized protein n=1 Tax=Rhodotorula pacifica TaxID=1495444 RepID=UPI0031808715